MLAVMCIKEEMELADKCNKGKTERGGGGAWGEGATPESSVTILLMFIAVD